MMLHTAVPLSSCWYCCHCSVTLLLLLLLLVARLLLLLQLQQGCAVPGRHLGREATSQISECRNAQQPPVDTQKDVNNMS